MNIVTDQTIEVANPNVAPEIKVNGQLISESDILQEMQYHRANNHREAMIKSVEALIINYLVDKACNESGLVFSAEEQADQELKISRLLSEHGNLPEASETECERYYQQHQSKFQTSPLMEIRHILLGVPSEDVNQRMQTQDDAKAILENLKQHPGEFERMVQQYSDCPSKATHGSLGQISQGQTVPEFERHLFNAEEGIIDYPVETRYGYHIVVVDRKIDGRPLPYEQVKDDVKCYLDEKVKRKNIAQFIHQLIIEADIEGFDFQLEASPLMQ